MIKHYKNPEKEFKWTEEQRKNISKKRGTKTTYVDSNGNKYVLQKDDPIIKELNLKGVNSEKVIAINKITKKWFWFKLEDFEQYKNIIDEDYLYNCPVHGIIYYRWKTKFDRLRINKKYECKCYKCLNEIDKHYDYFKQLTLDFIHDYPNYSGNYNLLSYIKYVLNKEFPTIENFSIQKYMFKNGLTEIPMCCENNCNNKVEWSKTGNSFTKHCNEHMYEYRTSGYEKDLRNFIDSLNIEFETQNRNLISNELDIYIPDKNIAIEFNGLYWHSNNRKDKKYHYNKWKECFDKNIQLIQIWEDDWIYKQDIVKSLIKSKLGCIENKIYARKCIIKEIDKQTKDKFLNDNHLQGTCVSKYNLGLYYNDELVSVMTFGKSRFEKDCFELIRFCNKIDTEVIGGANKLLKYFIKIYNANNQHKIISYASCDISNGNLYYKLGFEFVKHTGVDYWWWKNNKKLNRALFQKHKLVKQGFDKNKTEDEIMNEQGFTKIYGSGNLKFILK